MPTHKPSEGILNKKQNIIQAACLFAEQGYDGPTTLQIANEAGVTEPLIYYHFKGKTVSLLIAMLNGVLRKRGLGLEEMSGMRDVTVDFCKRSLVKM